MGAWVKGQDFGRLSFERERVAELLVNVSRGW